MEASPTVGRTKSMTQMAVVLAGAALLVMIVLSAIGHEGALWIIQGVLGLAAAVTAYRAGGTSPSNGLAFAAFVIGSLLFLVFFGFLIAEI